MELGRFGVWTAYRLIGEQRAGEAARLAEQLGYGAFWLGGSPRLPSLRPLLAASERIPVATGIVNVWRYEPATLAAEYAQLAAAFPGRLLLGIGVGHPEINSGYREPLAMMREFFDGLDGARPTVPAAVRCAAALGPRMLSLSAARSRGAHTYFVPVSHTKLARSELGAGPLLAVELACVLDQDVERARTVAREYAARYLSLRNYASNLLRLGYEQRDLLDGGSERLIDDVIAHGSAAQIAEVARAHIDAGADHVCVQPLGMSGVPVEAWTALAAALID